jgi:hypothetical protein
MKYIPPAALMNGTVNEGWELMTKVAGMERDFTPDVLERSRPAWDAMARVLADGRWHRYNRLVDAGTVACDVSRGWCVNLLRQAYKAGLLERYGSRKNRRYRRVSEETEEFSGEELWTSG